MTVAAPTRPRLHTPIAQFLVLDLDRALTFYRDRLGFRTLFIYDGFYAGIERDEVLIHLKLSDDPDPSRAFKLENEHLDLYVQVNEIDALYAEYLERGAPILKPIADTEWATREFTVQDIDGYILYFGEPVGTAEAAA